MGRCLLVVTACGLLSVVSAQAAKPPSYSTSVDFFGQPDRSAEVVGQPLAKNLALFALPGSAVPLPRPTGLMRPLADVAAHLRGHPGALVPAETRRVTTGAGAVYLVPTVRGWVCVQGRAFQTCHRGLLEQGVTWNFYSRMNGLDIVGIAADSVRAVTLVWGHRHRRAALANNVFFVHRPLSATSIQHLPPLGRLAISYRGARRSTTVAVG